MAAAALHPDYDRRWGILAVLSSALLLVAIDNTIINVALPDIGKDLRAGQAQLQWMVDAYSLVFAALLVWGGTLGDRRGRKGALLVGLGVFAAGSLWAGLAGTPVSLIMARASMGVGGALLMPATLAITTDVFPPKERPTAIAIWSAVSALGIALGPLAGGFVLEHFAWGAVFLINIPIAIVVAVLTFRVVPRSSNPHPHAPDHAGTVLLCVGLVGVLFGVIQAPAWGWRSVEVISALVVGVGVLVLFVWWERRVEFPTLDLQFFKRPRFSAATASVALVFFALTGSLFFLTQQLQLVLGQQPLEAGLKLLPAAVGAIVAAIVSAPLTERFGAKATVGGGLTTVAIGLALLSRVDRSGEFALLIVGVGLVGIGMGMAITPATDSIMGSIPPAQAGVGSAVTDTMQELGAALGVAVLGSVLAFVYRGKIDAIAGVPRDSVREARHSLAAAVDEAGRLGGGSGRALGDAAREAFTSAASTGYLVAAGVTLAGAALAFRFLPAEAPLTPERRRSESGAYRFSP